MWRGDARPGKRPKIIFPLSICISVRWAGQEKTPCSCVCVLPGLGQAYISQSVEFTSYFVWLYAFSKLGVFRCSWTSRFPFVLFHWERLTKYKTHDIFLINYFWNWYIWFNAKSEWMTFSFFACLYLKAFYAKIHLYKWWRLPISVKYMIRQVFGWGMVESGPGGWTTSSTWAQLFLGTSLQTRF